MRFALTQKVATFALAAVAVTPILSSGEIGVGWALALPALAAIGWLLEPPLTRVGRFRRAVTALVLTVLIVQIGRFVSGEPMARLGMEFTVFLLGIKLCSRGSAADYQQIVILSFLHIIGATIVMDDLSYAVSFLLFVTLSPPVLALSYLRKEMENRFGESPQSDGPEMLERLLRSKRVVSPGFLLGSSLLSLPVLVITAILFITFPRIGFGLLGRLPTSDAIVGFGNEVTLGDFDLIQTDNTVVIRLEPFSFRDAPPKNLSLKIRGAVFDRYENNTWTQSEKSQWTKLTHQGSDFKLEDKFINMKETPGFEVLLESIEPPLLFIPEGTGQITTYRIAAGGRPATRLLEVNQLGAIRYKDNAKIGLRYRVFLTSLAPYGNPPGDEQSYLEIPKGNEKIIALAHRFAGNGTQIQQIKALVHGLKTNYRYSTKLAASEANSLANTPIDRFLFTRRTGTCGHFATALTLMLRAIGIPSRLVTGFSSADWNPIGDYYAVRKRSAHSWTEAFLDGKWMTLDATPSSREETEPWHASAMSMLLDTMRMRWHKHVVGYDAATQFKIAIGIWRTWRSVFRTERSIEQVPLWPIWVLVGVAAIAGALLWLKRRSRNIISGSRARPMRRHAKAATKLYLNLERRLARLGHPRPFSRTPDEHVRILKHTAGPLADIAEKITHRYNEVRFGGRAFLSGELEQLRAMIRHM
ncbi:MAG: DUF3488 domain-containing protein [Proteobacteria bacterium]|nr:DUF3488 domain-containing protein [Pseudomonadota bacterium]